MLCLKKRRTYSFTQGTCAALPRRSKKDNNHYEGSLNMAITTLPRNNSREERSSRMVLTVTENTPADMLAGSMELLVQLPHNHYAQRVTVLRSTPMMDLLVQIATAHKLTASNYTLQAIGEHGLVLPHHPNTPIGALDALQVKLLPKQGTCVPRKVKQANQPFETTFRLQVHLPRNQLYVSRVSPKMNLGEILEEVCREKNLDSSKYELRHSANLEETLDLSLSLQDYQLQEVTLYAKQSWNLGQTLSTQDILALQRQEERRRQQTKQSVFGFKKSKESSLSMDSRSVSPARSDETTRSASPLQPPARPQRKRKPAPKPPADAALTVQNASGDIGGKDKMVINHSRNSSDSSGYHEASVLSDNPDSAARLPETLPRRSRMPGMSDTARRLAQTSQSSKSLSNLAVPGETFNRGISSTCLNTVGLRKKRAAPLPPVPRPLSSAISTQTLERIVDSEESLTSDIDPSKPPSDIGAPSKANSDIDCSKANSDIICISAQPACLLNHKPKPETMMCKSNGIQQSCAIEMNFEARSKPNPIDPKLTKVDAEKIAPVEAALKVEQARVATKRVGELAPLPKPRKINVGKVNVIEPPKAPKRKAPLLLTPPRILNVERGTNDLSREHVNSEQISETHYCTSSVENATSSNDLVAHVEKAETHSKSENDPAFSNRDQISQCDEISKITGDSIKQTSLKSSQNCEVKNNLELQVIFNSIESSSINFESKDKITSEDKFSEKERISDIDVDNYESLSSNEHSNNEGDTELHSVSAELVVLSLLESDVIPRKSKDNILEQDYEIKSKNIDCHDKNKNRHDNSFILSDDNSLNKSIVEPKSIQSKAHHRFISQKSKTRNFLLRDEENVETEKYVCLKDAKSGLERDRQICTVISTIPKCEHLDTIKENGVLNSTVKHGVAENIVESCEKRENDQNEESNNNAKNVKRAKVVRSQSKSDDFETDALKRQRRYLTLPTEDIAYALNLNLSARNSDTAGNKQIVAGYCTNCTRDVDIAKEDDPSEIESLLQKVSNTLSNVLPISSPPVSESSLPFKTDYATASVQTNDAAILDDFVTKSELVRVKSSKLYTDFPMGNTLNASMPNVIGADSQRDTLDSASAMSDNLSISDWEYQLPAPPSAFRDSSSPVFNDYDTVMLESTLDHFEKPPTSTVSDQIDRDMNFESMKNLLNNIDEHFYQKISNEKMSSETDIKRIESEPIVKQTTSVVSQKSTNSNLQKEIISELENKLESGALMQTINKDFDRRSMNNLSAPQIAPVDNTLSNFTITTYTRPKSLDIFEEFENAPNDYAKHSEKRFIKAFVTLSRNKTSAPDNYDKKNKFEKSDANNIDCKTEPKIQSQDDPSHRWRSLIKTNEKNNIQRSKSYISTFSNAKSQTEGQGIGEKKHEPHIASETANIKKATSTTDLNVNVRTSKEKFSQWRDNALKYQEEPTKEKQLQSLQVLKSILPQLKNAQQAEKNVPKEDNNTLSIKKIRYETGSNEHSTKTDTNTVSTCESRESECKQLSKKEDTKRYVYTGPPAISLGSWSERPNVNVQIKMDIDYKLGKKNTNNTININNMKNEKDATNYTDNINKSINKYETRSDFSANKSPEELTRKLIVHTTASGFKAPLSNRINVSDSKTNEGKPIVMGIELKKTSIEVSKEMPRNDEVDTTSLNFKELTKAYSQHASFKQNLKCDNINRHSADYSSAQVEKIKEITDSNVKQQSHVKLPKAFGQSDFSFKNQVSLHDIVQSSRAKRPVSIVGINGMSQNLGLQSEMSLRGSANNTLKINSLMPVMKGFKISINDSNTNNQINHSELSSINGFNNDPPKPPTMPVITGVTLKSATPVKIKSIPVQLDSRNMLLESIRNFGGREKLKSVAERY